MCSELDAGLWEDTMHERIQILVISSELENRLALVDTRPFPPCEGHMIQSIPEDIEQIRERIRKMSDAELRKYGRAARDLSACRVSE
jgi:hypothetical protein